MTVEEVNQVIKKLKKEGYSEDDILMSFYRMFQNDKINFEQLESLAKALGYNITEDFRNMSDEDKKKKGYEEV